jgi:hypothetical protein
VVLLVSVMLVAGRARHGPHRVGDVVTRVGDRDFAEDLRVPHLKGQDRIELGI